MDENVEAFVMNVSSLRLRMTIHPVRKAQLASPSTKEVSMPTKYLDFADVFLKKPAKILSERTGANKHAIALEQCKEPPYGPIYSLGPVELETFKTYIKTNLANGFMRVSKSPTSAPISFVRKPNGILRLCVNYQGLKNLTIKNWYPLPLISKSLS